MLTGQQEERAARLLANRGTSGGALPLPEVFREVLTVLWREKAVADDVLRKVIIEQISYKQKRILDIWGSWDAFCDDILGVLRDGEFIFSRDGTWSLTPKSVPGKQLNLLRDKANVRLRISFFEPEDHAAREVLGDARQKVEDLIYYLKTNADRHEAVRRAYNKATGISEVLASALAELDSQKAPASRSKKKESAPATGTIAKKKTGQSYWYRDWVKTVGWHTQEDARYAWNQEFPEKFLEESKASAFRHVTVIFREKGLMERRFAVSSHKKLSYEYRYTGSDPAAE